jgi:hypothetical protein
MALEVRERLESAPRVRNVSTMGSQHLYVLIGQTSPDDPPTVLLPVLRDAR